MFAMMRSMSCPLGDIDWVFFVVCPPHWILGYVQPDVTQRCFVSDDVFIVVALPDGSARGVSQLVDSFRCVHFGIADDFGKQHLPTLDSAIL